MKYKFTKIILLTAVVAGLTTACTPAGENIPTGKRYEFNNILDITYTPDTLTRCGGWFTDAGSWMGFTLPQKDHWVNGFCGPFSLDMNRRQWMAQSAVTVRYADQANVIFTPDSTCYFPGELYLSASSEEGKIIQRLNFLDASTALLRIHSDAGKELSLTASQWGKEIQVQTDQNTVIARHPSGEIVALTFTPDVVFGKFRIEFCQGGREAPGVPGPESYEVVCCMTRNNSFVEQSATVGTPVADKCNNCFHGDTVILRFHIFAQNLGEITFPAFFVGFEPFLRIA